MLSDQCLVLNFPS